MNDLEFAGVVGSVTQANEEESTCIVRLPNGTEVVFEGASEPRFEVGDAVVYREGTGGISIELLRPRQRRTARLVARLLEVSDDVARVLTPASVLLVPAGIATAADINKTVEYSEDEGVVAFIEDAPNPPLKIDVRAGRGSTDDPAKPFRQELKPGAYPYSSYAGFGDILARAREVVETPLKRRTEFEEIGRTPIRGILFSGPPGTGKTHLARVLAANAGARFYLISGPTIFSSLYGESAEILHGIFQEAKRTRKGSLIFIDELDTIAGERSTSSHEESDRVVAQLLTLMDGFHANHRVVVVGATNRRDAIEPALLRPGRFDEEIHFRLPDVRGRLEILSVHGAKIRAEGALDIGEIADRTESWSPAELNAIWSEAVLQTVLDGRSRVSQEDLRAGYEVVTQRVEARLADQRTRRSGRL